MQTRRSRGREVGGRRLPSRCSCCSLFDYASSSWNECTMMLAMMTTTATARHCGRRRRLLRGGATDDESRRRKTWRRRRRRRRRIGRRNMTSSPPPSRLRCLRRLGIENDARRRRWWRGKSWILPLSSYGGDDDVDDSVASDVGLGGGATMGSGVVNSV